MCAGAVFGGKVFVRKEGCVCVVKGNSQRTIEVRPFSVAVRIGEEVDIRVS